MSPLFRLLRPWQWVKNTLVLAPLFFQGELSAAKVIIALQAFFAFCAAASSAYCINDAVDWKRDQLHPIKRLRPVAGGEISPRLAFGLGTSLLLLSLVLGLLIGPSSALVLVSYTVVQLAYSTALKQLPIVDVLALASMYILRVLFGCVSLEIQPSSWLLVCCGLISLMLALGKRLGELDFLGNENTARRVLESYKREFLVTTVGSLGAATLVCYLLWCSEGIEAGRFSQIGILPSSLVVGYGLLRYQQLLFAGQFGEDLSLEIFKHKELLISILLFSAYLGLVIYLRWA